MNNINSYYNVSSCYSGKWLSDDEIVFLSTKSGVAQLWKKNIKSTNEAEQLTFFSERIWSYFVDKETKDILFTMDTGGNEQEQIYIIKSGKNETINLTVNDKARYQFGGVRNDKKTVVYSSNERSATNFDICCIDIDTKDKQIIIENSDSYNWPAALSPNGKYFLYNKLKGQSDNHMWIADLDEKIAENIDSEAGYAQYTNPAWKKDCSGFYFLTDKDSQFVYLAYYDIKSKKIKKIYEEKWDIESIELSHDDKFLALQINRDGYSYVEIYNTTTGFFENIPSAPKGVMGYYGMDWADKSNKLLFSLTSSKRPVDVWMLDIENDEVKKLTHSPIKDIHNDDMVDPILCHYESFDGLNVPFWFYKSPKSKDGPVPIVIDIHGGPEGQERPMFEPLTQYLINQGLSVVSPNVRGSVGYGKNYHHLDDIEKRLDSVKDIESLVSYLIKTKVAISDKIAVMGISYGGYMTLASVAFFPNLWAAAVDTVGMSNLETFLENTADYRRVHRESEYGSLKDHRDVLRKVSPIHKVDDIVTPLMVIHGANDPRVPVGEAEQIVKKLRDKGIDVEYLRYEDEGHGLAKKKNRIDCYPKVAEFLKKYLLS